MKILVRNTNENGENISIPEVINIGGVQGIYNPDVKNNRKCYEFDFDNAQSAFDFIEKMFILNKKCIYLPKEHLNWMYNRNRKILSAKEMNFTENIELQGNSGYYIHGTDDIRIANFFGRIVEKEYENASLKKRVRITKLARSKLWQ